MEIFDGFEWTGIEPSLTCHRANERNWGWDRDQEINRQDGMGGIYEQHPQPSRRDCIEKNKLYSNGIAISKF